MALRASARGANEGGYEFAQPPRVAGGGLFRDPAQPKAVTNIMYDNRVVRGNTYAAPVVPPSLAVEIERKAKDDEDRSRKRQYELRRREEEAARRAASTPSPVSGRRHADMQTETFLEVIADRAPEFEVAVQTDALLDRPPTPLFVPKSSGHDADTQVEPGELFDFDFEVRPVLDVLVGKTLETALLEVLQEDELAAIRSRQEEFESIRNAELAEVQRLEAEVKRRQAEKSRRVEQERARVKHAGEVQQKVAASAFARSYLSSLRSNVLQTLEEVGYFYDPRRREIESLVMPEIYAALEERTVARDVVARSLTDALISQALMHGKEAYSRHVAAIEEARREAAEQAQRAAQEAEAALAAAAAAAAVTDVVIGEGEGEGEGENAEEQSKEEGEE